MIDVRKTDIFDNWLRKLKDHKARAIINARILRLSKGNKGDAKYLRDGVSELRIDYGPGYRAYFTEVGKTLIILLCGGDKSAQTADINRATEIAKNLEVEE